MYAYKKRILIIGIALVLLIGLGSRMAHRVSLREKDNKFNTHWYDGNAEVSSYELTQNRYGELRKGDAVLIYVTEDFSKSKQVKLDRPDENKNDAIKVLKLNSTKEFRTGIYPYHLMTSVFTEVEKVQTLKTSHSVQEWCGHTFSQLNREKNGYRIRGFSYFQSEGDTDQALPEVLLEDEIWTLLRINPNAIPIGRQKFIESGLIQRLHHKKPGITECTISKADTLWEARPLACLTLEMANRKLTIYREKDFPFSIYGWEESYAEHGGKVLTTRAKLLRQYRLPYWKLNNLSHAGWRDSLALRYQ
ncbi:MAG: hypothetical protein KBF57_03595 [Saprospiraceae bacterium]|nr:hypothetical protein [Saprospiraceae bacterium]